MSMAQHFTRINTLEIKSQMEKRVGSAKAEKYFDLLARFLSGKLGKSEFDKLCVSMIGRENIRLHNSFLRAIIKNVWLSKSPPSKGKNSRESSVSTKKIANGFQRSISFQSLCKDLPQSPRKGRTLHLRDRKFKDHKEKGHFALVSKPSEQLSATELLSLGGRPPCPVEDGEEVDQSSQSPGTSGRNNPIEAPLGISFNKRAEQRSLSNRLLSSYYAETCYGCGQLPDTISLKKKLQQKLEMEGLEASMEFTNLLNTGLDVFMKRLIKPYLETTGSRSWQKQTHQRVYSASVLDFRVAMELNPMVLGEDWPTKLEKIQLLASEE